MISWEQIYDYLGIKDFIYFISSPAIQDQLFPVKIVFILFSAFFLCAVIYFYVNSSYIKYQFLQDVVEFFSWHAYGSREMLKQWEKIKKKIDSSLESEHKLAIIEADDFLQQLLEEKGYQGDTLEELIESAGKVALPDGEGILDAHKVRNEIVYNPDYSLDTQVLKNTLSVYEKTIKNILSV